MFTNRTRKPVDPKTGIGIGLAFLTISVFLYLWSDYFSSATIFVQAFFLFFGLAGTGSDLDRLVKQNFAITNEHRFADIFNNFGLGLALVFLWALIIRFFPGIGGRSFAFISFMAGTHFLCLGLVNLVFAFRPEADVLNEQEDQVNGNQGVQKSGKAWAVMKGVYIVINSLVALGASILTILSILKIV
jgi:hypothetical protein